MTNTSTTLLRKSSRGIDEEMVRWRRDESSISSVLDPPPLPYPSKFVAVLIALLSGRTPKLGANLCVEKLEINGIWK